MNPSGLSEFDVAGDQMLHIPFPPFVQAFPAFALECVCSQERVLELPIPYRILNVPLQPSENNKGRPRPTVGTSWGASGLPRIFRLKKPL
jgi:hypothetical protein